MSTKKSAMEKLNPDQLKMLSLILEGKNNLEIAKELDIHINTFYQRRAKDVFQEALRESYKDAVSTAQGIFSQKAAWAAKRIIEMVDDPEATRVQFQAACKVYDSAVGVTIEDFEDRLLAVEESVTREV